jgi:pimeloyl-ACP methyl ester carboxylesterase
VRRSIAEPSVWTGAIGCFGCYVDGLNQEDDRRARRPVILVGHSYGGVVITEAGNDPKVAGPVYITFAPDSGKSVETLIKNPGITSEPQQRPAS